ncbi:MAG: MlaD family protein [Bacteroidales bacterium]|nr:MlaD family protein [Bacteroidales bacterium]MCF8343838.1 MlaD family protein [Bacteroidales bacterium]MCF8351027.1 MlaD family protein [Bacteroidales bacterium]MCF8375843.1 MlaD family protein [Bacteroidales bacterium]MCF8401724.1 MlaD family protein [Bacteroidales bacterium]
MKYSRELVIGLTFIIALGIFIWGFNFLKGISVFEKERVFYGLYDRVDGLMKSNPVKINGMKVGQVKDLYFDQEYSGNIIVEMSLSTDFPIPANSTARIYSSDLMGSKAVEIKIGNSEVMAESGDTLKTSIELGLKEEVNKQVEPLKRKAENLIMSIDSMVTTVQTFFNDTASLKLYSTLDNIALTVEQLKHTAYRVDTFVVTESDNLSKVITNIEEVTYNLTKNRKNIDQIIANMKAVSDSLAKADIPATFAAARNSLENLSNVINKIDQGEGSAGMLVNNKELYEQLVKASESLDALLKEVKENPKKFVKFSVF